MENEAEKLQADLKIAAAFLKAHEEVKASRQKRKSVCMKRRSLPQKIAKKRGRKIAVTLKL